MVSYFLFAAGTFYAYILSSDAHLLVIMLFGLVASLAGPIVAQMISFIVAIMVWFGHFVLNYS